LELVGTRTQNQNNYFTDTLPDLVMGHSMAMGEQDKYDAIIVDEGQDFGESRRTALGFLLKEQSEGTQWLIFSDQNQNLYQGGKENLIEAEVVFRLYHNCRNTERLNSAANSVCQVDVLSMDGVPKGEHPQVGLCKSELMAQKAWDLVQQISPEGGSVILSPFTLANSCMKDSPKGHGLKLSEDINQLGQSGYVFFSTIKSFKGLEAVHVVLVHADKPGANRALAAEDIYVAFTRATTRLDIVTTNKEAEAWYQQSLQESL
jgi:superfamily I DNA/RNA helicase